MGWDNNDTIRSDWNFDTIKSTSVMGTFSSAAKDLIPETDDGDMSEEPSIYEEDQSIDTGNAVNGDSALGSVGARINQHAAHSTIRIQVVRDDEDPPFLGASADFPGESSVESPSPAIPPPNKAEALGAPPAYSTSMLSSRRSSYAARHKTTGSGTIMREADLGTGLDTIRPVKKVDAVGSLKLSSEYVGTTRGREDVPLSPTSFSREPTGIKRRGSQSEKAGRAMIDDVVLPVLQNVWLLLSFIAGSSNVWQAIRDDMDAREIESLSMITRGFAELREVNPALSYGVILDILSGINEWVALPLCLHSAFLIRMNQKHCCTSTRSDCPRAFPA